MYQLRDLMKSKRHVGAGLQHIDKTDGNTIRQFRPLEWCSYLYMLSHWNTCKFDNVHM